MEWISCYARAYKTAHKKGLSNVYVWPHACLPMRLVWLKNFLEQNLYCCCLGFIIYNKRWESIDSWDGMMKVHIEYWNTIKLEIKLYKQYPYIKAYEQCLEWDGYTHPLPCHLLYFSSLVHTMNMGYFNSHFPQTIWVYSNLILNYDS